MPKLIDGADALKAFEAARSVVARFAKRAPEVLTAIYTGASLRDLAAFAKLTAAPGFEIVGLLSDRSSWRQKLPIFCIENREVHTVLRYQAESISVHFGQEAGRHINLIVSKMGGDTSVATGGLTDAMIEELLALFPPFPRDSPLLFQPVETPSRSMRVFRLSVSPHAPGIVLDFPTNDRGAATTILRRVFESASEPEQIHFSVKGEFDQVEKLSTGAVVPCRDGCPWHLAFTSLGPSESTVDASELDAIAVFLAHHEGRNRVVRWGAFDWVWQQIPSPTSVNEVIWQLRRDGRVTVDLRSTDPVPRAQLTEVKNAALAVLNSHSYRM